MSSPQVTILVPNYKTLTLTKLCLRLLRKHTNPELAKVVVIDNDSGDESLDYLRTLDWIELIERKSVPGESAVASHSAALDMALDCVDTPFVLSIHTDTLVKHSKWLEFLLAKMATCPTVAGVGSWKLEDKPLWRRVLKGFEYGLQWFYYTLIGKKQHGLQGVGDNYFYLRSHCAMYRMDLIRQYGLHFSDGDKVAGKGMHKTLVEAGYQMLFVESPVLIKYLEHINHATTVLNPELSTREKSVVKGLRRIKDSLARLGADAVLQDITLDS